MSRPSLIALCVIGLVLFLGGILMVLRVTTGEPYLSDPVLLRQQQALYASGAGIWLFSIYYFGLASGAVLICTTLTALFLRRKS